MKTWDDQELQARFLVLVGNYGSGKTELALNLALDDARRGKTTLVDLDIVNPYFRSGEKAELLQRSGVRVLMPTFAMTTVDIPALPAEIQSVFETPSDHVIFDVGGDDTGAAALGRYYPSFMRFRPETRVCLVVNCMRPLTETPEEIAELAQRIEIRGRLKIDTLINNTNISHLTEAEMLRRGEETVLRAAERIGVDHVVSSGLYELASRAELKTPFMPVQRYMVPEWMES